MNSASNAWLCLKYCSTSLIIFPLCSEYCRRKKSGVYAHPESRTHYIMCYRSSRGLAFSCGRGYMWSKGACIKQECNFILYLSNYLFWPLVDSGWFRDQPVKFLWTWSCSSVTFPFTGSLATGRSPKATGWNTPHRWFQQVAPIHSLWDVFQWNSGMME